MASATIRVRPETRAKLQSLAEETGASIPDLLEAAIDALRRRQFLTGLASDFEALRSDPKAWAQELQERAEWDAITQVEHGADSE